jgi:hypothetical protein
VPTTSHLVKTSTQEQIIWEIWVIWDNNKPICPNLRLVGTLWIRVISILVYLVPQDEIELQDSVLDSVLPLRPDRQITMLVQGTEPPQVGYLQVGRQVMQGVEPPQAGRLQVGRKAMLYIRFPEMGSPPGGSDVSSRAREFSRTRNQDQTSQDNMLAVVLKQIAGQMVNMTHNQSYSGTGHKVKEAYDAYVPQAYKSKFYLEKLPVPCNVLPRDNTKDRKYIKVIDSIFKKTFIEDSSNFMWRPEVINAIHKANHSVQKRKRFLDRKETRLAANVRLHDIYSKHVSGSNQ